MARRIPLNALAAFEAVARTGSLSRAASELGLATSSVSRTIRNFETATGLLLFRRNARGVSLTGEGRLLYETTRRALSELRVVRGTDAPAEREACITTLPSVAAYWLPTWLRDAERAGIRIAVDATLVLRRPGETAFDVSIRYGDGNWKGLRYQPLFPGREFAVAAPEVARHFRRGDLRSGWSRTSMLHDRYFDSWYRWCAANLDDALPPGQGNLVFDDRVTLVEATLAGAGVALLPDPLAIGHVRSGALRLLPAGPIAVKDTYYLAAQPRDDAAVPDALVEIVARRAGEDYGWLSQQLAGSP